MNPAKQWFDGLSADKKKKVYLAGAVTIIVLVILLVVIATDNSDKPKVDNSRRNKIQPSLLTGKDPGKVSLDSLVAQTRAQANKIDQMERQLQSIANNPGGTGRPGSVGVPFPPDRKESEVVALPGSLSSAEVIVAGTTGSVNAPAVVPVKVGERQVDVAVAADPSAAHGSSRSAPAGRQSPTRSPTAANSGSPNGPQTPRDNSDVFGASSTEPQVVESPVEPPPPPPKLNLRVLSPRADAGPQDQVDSPQANAIFTSGSSSTRPGAAPSRQAREPEFYLPLGSIISGTLLTGMDAPASGSAARKDPFPALLRVKHEAVLPNAGLMDLRECFLVASAYGELASQRVYLRAEGMSCLRADGAIIESSIDAYASGSDGKAGVRGTVVDKTADLVRDSLIAGFLGGLAKGFKPQQSQQVALNQQGGSVPFQFPDPSFVAGSGLLGGASNAADRIAGIYEDLARQIVPVIEINAGIPVDFIMTRGTTLRFKKAGEISSNARAVNQVQGQGRPGQLQGDQPVTTSFSGTNGLSVMQGAGSSSPPISPRGAGQTVTSAVRRP